MMLIGSVGNYEDVNHNDNNCVTKLKEDTLSTGALEMDALITIVNNAVGQPMDHP